MNRRCVLGFLSTVLFAFCLATAEAQVRDLGGELIPERTASGGLLVITAGQLVDPETGVTQSNQKVVIEDGIILEVGEDVAIPSGATLIDLSDLTVLPGLIDSHTHLAGSYNFPASNLKEYNVDVATAERAIQGLLNAQSMLATGFTTVRDLGNAGHFADAALGEFLNGEIQDPAPNIGQLQDFSEVNPGRITGVLGPTFLYSGKIISVFGGQFRVSPDAPDIGLLDYYYADSRDELRKAIRENLYHGATWIKLVIDDYRYMWSVEDIQFIVEESRQAGVKVAAHAVTEEGARLAIEGGVASIEHGYEMTDEQLEQAKAQGIVLVGCDLADVMAQAYRGAIYEKALDRLERAHRIGVEMAYGSDILMNRAGLTRGEISIDPIETWVKAGIPHADTLRALITNGARLLGIENERGNIRPGMAADIIATPENPLDDIMTLKQVSFVMKDGVVFRHD
ncbi:MAG: hypothetical protein CMP01_05335 [Woeseiaceae bacterium]|jgi:imidazolonepropionase-like amidohydrolase|nr:hypothetical protein [Woeseiaceae bacterium]|tara:strand:- start:204 stop:1565 length:1362 start_codon:yes stop_codon:yes gene_type:complete